MITNYCVYKHTNKINGKVYIGITGQDPKKRWGKNGRSYKGQIFYRAIQKYDWNNFNHEILADNLTKEKAEQYEISLISFYRETLGTNNVYNVSAGGEGNSSICKDETKKKMSEAKIGRNRSEEAKRSISEGMKGEKNHKSIKVYCEETDVVYGSMREAERETGCNRKSITQCCRNEIKSIKGLHFKFM